MKRIILSITLISLLCALCLLAACGGGNAPVKVSVLDLPKSTKVVQGGEPDLSGGTVEVEYADGTTAEIAMTKLSYRGLNSDELGTQTVALTYTEGGKTVSTTIDLTVVSPKVTSVELTMDNVKTDYIEGESFDKTGLVVKATYQTGEVKEVRAYDVSPQIMKVDTKEVSITYRGVTRKIPVTVTARAIVSAEITALPAKLDYFVGEAFDPEGITLTVTNNDGTVENFTSEDGLSFYHGEGNMEYYGAYTTEDVIVRVVAPARYGDASATFTLRVIKVAPTSVTLLAPTTAEGALLFAEDDIFYFYDDEAVSVRLVMNNGDAETVYATTDYFDYPTDPLSLDATSVEAFLRDDPSLTVTIPVAIVTGMTISKLPDVTDYELFDEVDLTGLELLVTTQSGAERVVSVDSDRRIRASVRTIEDESLTSVTVYYLSFSADFDVTVSAD